MSNESFRVVDSDGTVRYYDVVGRPHREDGPAVQYTNGSEYWYYKGTRHREGGPAIWVSENEYAWFHMGKYHREDGPALSYPDGEKAWYKYGRRHNLHGPAVIYKSDDGKLREEWWYEGRQYKNEADMLRKAVPSIEKLSKMFKEVQCERQLG
jgi:hypothetical protein